MNHFETHLYTYAIALSQGNKITPENLQGMREKAIWNGHSEDNCRFVEVHNQAYIKDGTLSWEKVSDQAPNHNRVHMICKKCGSQDVRKDAYAEWCPDNGDWVLHSTYDHCICEWCENESDLQEINEATQLEIQVFGMVKDGTEDRQATAGETPDSYAVLVATTPLESGYIVTFAEHDGLAYIPARRVLSTLTLAYPFAPVTMHNCHKGAV